MILGIAQGEGAAAIGQRQRAVQIEDVGVGVLGPLAANLFAEAGAKCVGLGRAPESCVGRKDERRRQGKGDAPAVGLERPAGQGLGRTAHVPEQERLVRFIADDAVHVRGRDEHTCGRRADDVGQPDLVRG